VLDCRVRDHRADVRLAVDVEPLERVDVAQPDQRVGVDQSLADHDQERLAARDHLCAVAVLGEQVERLVDGGGIQVVHR
jgi:hypothetical protein